jgi:hypothetical protein
MSDKLIGAISFIGSGVLLVTAIYLMYKALKWICDRVGLTFPNWMLALLSGIGIAGSISVLFLVGCLSHQPSGKAKTAAYRPTFPWPPPSPSSAVIIPRSFFSHSKTLGESASRLESALTASGYLEKSYWLAPGGIAIVTRLERIHRDGSPFPDPNRWPAGGNYTTPLSIAEYIRILFAADEGFYRVVVFVISDQPFNTTMRPVSPIEANYWLGGGLNAVPDDVAQQPIQGSDNCTALIYEFEKPHGADPRLAVPDGLGAKQHLIAAGLYAPLFGEVNRGGR